MAILEFLVYGFTFGLIGAAVIALVVGIVTLAIECYKGMGMVGVVANVAAWAGFFGGFVVPIVFISNPALFLVVLIGGIVVSNTLMFFAMGAFHNRKGTISLVGHWSRASQQYPTIEEVSAALTRMK